MLVLEMGEGRFPHLSHRADASRDGGANLLVLGIGFECADGLHGGMGACAAVWKGLHTRLEQFLHLLLSHAFKIAEF